MISKIHFHHYRKLKNISIDLSKNINIISGTNGTCKSSILHIISNSFQAVKSTKCGDAVKKCIEIIKAINEQYNPKLESLTRGDNIKILLLVIRLHIMMLNIGEIKLHYHLESITPKTLGSLDMQLSLHIVQNQMKNCPVFQLFTSV